MVRHFKYYDPVNPCPDCPPTEWWWNWYNQKDWKAI